MNFLMTIDVEAHSFCLNREDPSIIEQVHKQGLPRLLSLLSKYDAASTFYFTGMFAEQSPESVELVLDHGHEIGCHGYDHSPKRAFDVLSYSEQVEELHKAKRTLEPIAGKIESFRAPALRINNTTVRALEDTGFTNDSSIAPQRFDGPMTLGAIGKLRWLNAPRKPYMLSYLSPVHRGNSKIMEIPLSAAIVPFIGTTMRISPLTNKVIKKCLFYESRITDKPIVFLFHPNECLDAESRTMTTRRSNNKLEYLFADLLRQKLKLKNMGNKSIKLLDEILKSAREYGFSFATVRDFRKKIIKE